MSLSQAQYDYSFLGEPHLEFRYKEKVVDPKTGLTIFGRRSRMIPPF